MSTAVLFALAAAGGTAARVAAVHYWPGAERGTLAVNVAGSLALGLLAGWAGPGLAVVGVGGLGALTTFSAFAADASALADEAGFRRGASYVALSLAAGVLAALVGITLAG